MIEPLEARIAPATFTVINVNDSGAGSLRDALDKADQRAGADTIVFRLPAPAAHSENIIKLTSGELTSKGNVTITGPSAGRLIIDGDATYRVLHIADGVAGTDSPTTISGLSIVNGKTTGDGAGVLSTESLTLKSVVVSGNFGAIGGGVAVFGDAAAGTKATLSSSLFTSNRSDDTGGGLALLEMKAVSISKTTVLGNSAPSGGGLFVTTHATGTGIAITGCNIAGNFSTSSAGGLFVSDFNPATSAKIVISSTRITANTVGSVGDGGGGVFLGAGDLIISGSVISNNSALYSGGGLAAKDFTSLAISGSTISGNLTSDHVSSDQGGGGIHLTGGGVGSLLPVKISGSRITENRSDVRGGGLYAIDGIALIVTGSTFARNTAGDAGGGIATSGGVGEKVNLTVTGSVFADNAGTEGGGIAATQLDGVVSISASKVTGNRSVFGGGGLEVRSETGTVVIKNVIASGNFTLSKGGGLLIFNTPDFKVSGGSFTGNGAESGGGIYLQNSTGSILGATISGNAAMTAGGGVFHDTLGAVTLQVAKVIANNAPAGPNVSGVFTFV